MRRLQGATLIELVIVLVVLGIVAALSSSFVVTAVTAYNQAAERNKLILRGRAAIERLHRQLRIALPYSVRVSASGNCLEFMQLTGGANYLGQLPDANNGAPAVNFIDTAPFTLGLGGVAHVAVGAMSTGEVYTTATTASRTGVSGLNGSPATQINLTSNHRFLRNSINERVYLMADPERFCVVGSSLVHYGNYGLLTGALTDVNPGGQSALLSDDILAGTPTFSLSPATESRSALVLVNFGVSRNGETVTFNQQMLVRNVP